MENYEKLLKKAFEKIPSNVSSVERFQIPVAKIENVGNKTIIKNFNEIANRLRRERKDLAKYFFNELAAPGFIQGNTLILQRKLSSEAIQKKIEKYVRDYVYCKACGKPDTIIVKEGKKVYMLCEACGEKRPIR